MFILRLKFWQMLIVDICLIEWLLLKFMKRGNASLTESLYCLICLTKWCGLWHWFLAGSVMGGDPGIVKKRFDNWDNDGCSNYVPVSIPTKNLSFCLSFATYAKSLWLHFWYCLVGNRSQFDRLLCCLSCKLLFFTNFNLHFVLICIIWNFM